MSLLPLEDRAWISFAATMWSLRFHIAAVAVTMTAQLDLGMQVRILNGVQILATARRHCVAVVICYMQLASDPAISVHARQELKGKNV
jgi:hypothetical protein